MITVPVRELMRTEVVSVPADATVSDAAALLAVGDVGSVVVTDDGHPAGVLTATDVLRLVTDGVDIDTHPVTDAMSTPVVTVGADVTIDEAAATLKAREVKQAVVIEDGELVGIVSTTELSYYLPRIDLRDIGDAESWEYEYEDHEAVGVSVGDVVRFSKRLTDDDVRRFARASGDTNRLHVDDDFAATTRFGHRIVHGVLSVGVISAALAQLPGLPIYISQNTHFLAPVDVGARVTARCEVIESLGHDRFRLQTPVHTDDGTQVLSGEAVVLVDSVEESESGSESEATEAEATEATEAQS